MKRMIGTIIFLMLAAADLAGQAGPDPYITGSIAGAGQAVTLTNLNGAGSAAVQLTTMCTCTLVIETTVDGATWTTSGVTAPTTTGIFPFALASVQGVRLRASAYTSGTATVALRASAATAASTGGGGGGDASAAKQDIGNASLASIDGKITAVNTGAVVVASSALPSGAATDTKQDTGNTSLASIDGKTPALVTGRVPVDGSGVTQPVSIGSAVAVNLNDSAGNGIASATGTPGAGSRGLVVRNVPSGTQTVAVSGSVAISGTVPVSGPIQVTQSTPGATVNAWPIKITDGTKTATLVGDNVAASVEDALVVSLANGSNGIRIWDGTRTAAVVASNTAASTFDTSLAVSLAPASPLPTGSNVIGQVTANAGTNLNTSALAVESGGNLAAIAAAVKPWATPGTYPTSAVMVGGYDGVTNDIRPVRIVDGDPLGDETITMLVRNIPSGAAYASGTLTTTGGSTMSLTVPTGAATVVVEVTGTWTGALDSKCGQINTSGQLTFCPAYLRSNGGALFPVTSITTNGTYIVNAGGVYTYLLSGNTTSGTASIRLASSSAPSVITAGPSTIGITGAATSNAGEVVAGVDPLATIRPMAMQNGALVVTLAANSGAGLPKPACNAVRRTNCAPKVF